MTKSSRRNRSLGYSLIRKDYNDYKDKLPNVSHTTSLWYSFWAGLSSFSELPFPRTPSVDPQKGVEEGFQIMPVSMLEFAQRTNGNEFHGPGLMRRARSLAAGEIALSQSMTNLCKLLRWMK
jgi:hypothetical protein